jgi:glycosyltransferase involved in cell wall biosynthesis
MAATVALIIPVLNERQCIEETLIKALDLGADEIIVVDGNSTDGTYEFIKDKFPQILCLRAPYANRAFQMNLGANEVMSDILVFMHADLRLPDQGIAHIKDKMQQGYIGGGFMKKYDPQNTALSMYGFLLNHIYTRLFRNLVGSNAIFIRRDLFVTLKGFPQVEFMEDVIFAQVFKKLGKLAVISDPVVVSSRRYLRRGVLRQIIRNFCVMFNYNILHKHPKELKRIYTVNCYEC